MTSTSSFRRTLLFYILGTLLSLTVVFTFIELTTRVVSFIRGDGFQLALHERDATDNAVTSIYQFHPFAGFIFKPNQVIIGGHPEQQEMVEVYTDEHGFLSEPQRLPLVKSSGEIRIATIGGSTTASLNLRYSENWPGRLGALVQEALPNQKITVINAGIPGFNTAQSIGNLALRVMPFKPDIVVIYHAYNDLKVVRPGFDIKPDFSNVHEQAFGQHDRPNTVLRALNFSMFYVRIRNSYRRHKIATANVKMLKGTERLERVPESAATIFEHNMRMPIAIGVAGGAKVVLSSFATLHELGVDYDEVPSGGLSLFKQQELVSIMRFTPGLELNGVFNGISQYNEITQELAQEWHTAWADNANLIAHSDENFIDRVHFTTLGAERMAKNLLPVVLEQLAQLSNFDAAAPSEQNYFILLAQHLIVKV